MVLRVLYQYLPSFNEKLLQVFLSEEVYTHHNHNVVSGQKQDDKEDGE